MCGTFIRCSSPACAGALRPTLTEIAWLPAKAASGERRAGRRIAIATAKRVLWEAVVTLVLMVVLLIVMLSAGLLLAEALQPAIEAFLGYLVVALMYVQIVPDASTTAVLVALGGTLMFLILDLAVVLVASTLFVGKVHKILQRRFHDREPLRAHRRFFVRGSLALMFALAFPLLYITVAQPAVEWLIDQMTSTDTIPWVALLTSGPLVLVVAFVGSFVLVRGHKAIGFIAKYRVPKLGHPLTHAKANR